MAATVPTTIQTDWSFLTRAVWTRDEAAGEVKQFPAWDYLRRVVEWRERQHAIGHRVCAIDKSRRMLLTWLYCSLYLYNVLTRRNQADYIASRKLEASCELLGRLEFVWRHIPASVWPDKPEVITHAGPTGKGFKRLDVPGLGSFVEAVAEGPHQLRQYSASHVLCDEAAFWESWSETWVALRPTIQGGGYVDLITTACAGSPVEGLMYGSAD